MIINIVSGIIKLIQHALSRWKILSAYIAFSFLTMGGWYIDIIGAFSSQDDYAASFRATHGDMGLYNVLAFFVGTLFYMLFMLYDYKKLRLDKKQGTAQNVQTKSVFGDANQIVGQNNTNSPIVSAPGNTFVYKTVNGISEERCRAIFDEKWGTAVRELTFESFEKAEERRNGFRQVLLPRLEKEGDGYRSFADPGFQYLLMDAQRSAVTTDRVDDFQLLSELLSQRVKDGHAIKSQIQIKRAIEVLPYLPDDALLGLTVSFVLLKVVPLTGGISQGMNTLDDTYKHIIGNNQLPLGTNWIETLGACGLVNIAVGGILKMNTAVEILSSKLDGYCLPGIKKGSKNYDKAFSLLGNAQIDSNILVDHELNSEFVRLAVVTESQIDQLKNVKEFSHGIKVTVYANDEQKTVLHQIFRLYESDEAVKTEFVGRLDVEFQKYHYLKMVIDWWNQMPEAFQLTMTGSCLANANANMFDRQVPIMQ